MLAPSRTPSALVICLLLVLACQHPPSENNPEPADTTAQPVTAGQAAGAEQSVESPTNAGQPASPPPLNTTSQALPTTSSDTSDAVFASSEEAPIPIEPQQALPDDATAAPASPPTTNNAAAPEEPGGIRCNLARLVCDTYNPAYGCHCNDAGPLSVDDCAANEQLFCELHDVSFLPGVYNSELGTNQHRVNCRCITPPTSPEGCPHPAQFNCTSYDPPQDCFCNGAITSQGLCDPPLPMDCQDLATPYGCECAEPILLK